MAYSHKNSKGKMYWLHQKGKLMFFSGSPDGAVDLPEGLEIIENSRTGLPMVRKKK